MLGLNKKKDSDISSVNTRWKDHFPSIRKVIFSSAVVVLLFPNILSVGIAAGEEIPSEEPIVEEVEMKAAEVVEELETIDELPPVEEPVPEPILPEEAEEVEGPTVTPEVPELKEPAIEEPSEEELVPEVTAEVVPEESPETPETDVEEVEATDIQVAQEVETYHLGLQIQDKMTDPVTNIGVRVTDTSGEVIQGAYNESGEWRANEEVPVGRYTITFTPPNGGAVGLYPGQSDQSAEETGTDNVFTIDVNEDNLTQFTIVYGSFIYDDEYPLRLSVLEDQSIFRNDIDVRITNEAGTVIDVTAMENRYYTDTLPVGRYTVTFSPPEGKQILLEPSITRQGAKNTATKNVFTVDVDSKYMNFSFTVFGHFVLVDETPDPVEEEFNLAIDILNEDDEYDTTSGVRVTNAEGVVIDGAYNMDTRGWYATAGLPAGRYTITLTPPAGVITSIDSARNGQRAVATDTANVYTIDINAENVGLSQVFFGAFRLTKGTDEEPTDPGTEESSGPEKPATPVKPSTPEKTITPNEPVVLEAEDRDTPDTDKIDDTVDTDEIEDTDHAVDTEDMEDAEETDDDDILTIYLPRTGIASSTVGLGIVTLLSGLGLYVVDKKRKK